MMRMSAAARSKLTEPWEERVNYVYDDKAGKVHGRYPEWDGGHVRGTLTIGFGHTDAAGEPQIHQGMRISDQEGDEIFASDIAPCEEAVNKALKVKVSQHQFDALTDTWFNCPKASLAAIKLINAGNVRAVPAKLLQYTFSKGEHMEGLTHRRNAEIAWFNTPDAHEPPTVLPNAVTVQCPKGEENPPPKSILQSKTAAAGATMTSFGLAEALQWLNDAAQPLKDAKQNLDDLGVFDHLAGLLHDPVAALAIGGAVAALGLFIVWDRRQKLLNDHV